MLNQDKFRTAEERVMAFEDWCIDIRVGGECHACELNMFANHHACFANWLALEAEEEKPENCPFCGGEVDIQARGGEKDRRGNVYLSLVRCQHCGYTSMISSERDSIGAVIAAHNRVARAVAKEGGGK